jgi:hypothetical protein
MEEAIKLYIGGLFSLFLVGCVASDATDKSKGQTACEKIEPTIRYELGGGAGHYNYAPSFIIDEYGIIYGYMCQNRDPFQIVDYIYLYKGIPTENGYVWQPGIPVLAPSEEGWDNCHICDPDVRKFKTRYKGETYEWIMTYLGVDQWDCKHNQVGLAIAKNIEGPWIKFDGNPIVPYESRDKWGTGQSTTIIKDSATITLVYHSTDSNGPVAVRDIKLDDLSDIVLGEEYNIPDFPGNTYPTVYEDKVFLVSEQRSEDYKNVIPTWVGDLCLVHYKEIKSGKSVTETLAEPGGWTEIGRVSPKNSRFPRNHNPGFLTDIYGYAPSGSELIVFYTPAVTGENWLWSYDLYSAKFDLNEFFNKK